MDHAHRRLARGSAPACCGALIMLLAIVAPAAEGPLPWARTEARDLCQDFAPLRRVYFGDLHVHTSFSHDAFSRDTRVDPRGAYGFARGLPVHLPDVFGGQRRRVEIDRPLDFTAVTDHAEFLGETRICGTAGGPGFDDPRCVQLRSGRFAQWKGSVNLWPEPVRHALCFLLGVDCEASRISAWEEVQAAAEQAYDRSETCGFTSFVAYEHSAAPFGAVMHRNVIFRNDRVPVAAAGYIETGSAVGAWPFDVVPRLYGSLERECTEAEIGCDALVIPHNSNSSLGWGFWDPADEAEAERRMALERLIEIHQEKGSSECRFDRLLGRGVDTEDELCTFEQLEGLGGVDHLPRRSLVRNTLVDGLAVEDQLGVNPFQLGFVGGSDNHNGTPGNTGEATYTGSLGRQDVTRSAKLLQFIRNPGGLTAIWAEENSRDALFAALRRREVYATSGTRPVVRLFAGELPEKLCKQSDPAAVAYAHGAPMGSEIGSTARAAGPRFAVLAWKDPGTREVPGADLQRVQVVKGWHDAAGEARERVFDVVTSQGDAGVDPATCEPVGQGVAEACRVWTDPEFDASQRAVYYARVLENPTCRYTTRICQGMGVDPFASDCLEQAASRPAHFAHCCRNESNDPYLSPTIQERAWTSPIWYRPEQLRWVRALLDFGSEGDGSFTLRAGLGRSAFDPTVHALALHVSDGGEAFGIEVPPGSMQLVSDSGEARAYWLVGEAAGRHGLRWLRLALPGAGEARLDLATLDLELAGWERVDHFVELELRLGSESLHHQRLWRMRGGGKLMGR